MRRPFSLMEIVIVMVLVGIIAGVSTFSFLPFYQSYRFKMEVAALYELCQELQLEAMTLQSDMKMEIAKKKDKWIARSSSDEPALKSQTIDLSHVTQISEPGVITFYSNGHIRPMNMILFSYKKEKQWLDFSRGHLIKRWETSPQPFVYEKLPDLDRAKKSLTHRK